jgi:hypothetical protein
LAFLVPTAMVLFITLFSELANNTKGIVPTAVDRYWLSSMIVTLTPGDTNAAMVISFYKNIVVIYYGFGKTLVLSVLCKGLLFIQA